MPNKKTLARLIPGVAVRTFRTLSSTNDYLKEIPFVTGPLLIVSDSQTAGKGRLGRSFSSARGGIYFSLGISDFKTDDLAVTPIAAVCVAKAIEKLTGKSVQLKWVNDIYLDGRKLVGILCERRDSLTVIGIGINYKNRLPKELSDTAVTLYQKNERGVSRERIIAETVNNLLSAYHENGWEIEYYRDRLLYKDQTVCCKNDGEELVGILRGVDRNGALLLEKDGGVVTVCSGEMTVRKVE